MFSNTCPVQIAHSMLDRMKMKMMKTKRGYVAQRPVVSSCTSGDKWDRSPYLGTGDKGRMMRWRLSGRDTTLIND